MGGPASKQNQTGYSRNLESLEALIARPQLKSRDVLRLQTTLNNMNHDAGPNDSDFGPLTAAGLMDALEQNPHLANKLSPSVTKALRENAQGESLSNLLARNASVEAALKTAPSTPAFGDMSNLAFPSQETVQKVENAPVAFLGDLSRFCKEIGQKITLFMGQIYSSTFGNHIVTGIHGAKSRTDSPTAVTSSEPKMAAPAVRPGPSLSENITATVRRGWDSIFGSKVDPKDIEKDKIAYEAFMARGDINPNILKGAMIAGQETGAGFRYLVALGKIESDHGKCKTNNSSSASRLKGNIYQITTGTMEYLNDKYGNDAKRDLAKYGISFNEKRDWRIDPAISAYMAGKYSMEAGSRDWGKRYAFYFSGSNTLANMADHPEKQDIALAETRKFASAARSNRSLFYKNGEARSAEEVFDVVAGKIRREERRMIDIVKTHVRENPDSVSTIIEQRADSRKPGSSLDATPSIKSESRRAFIGENTVVAEMQPVGPQSPVPRYPERVFA